MEMHEPSSALSGRSITSLPTPTSAGGRDDERQREAAPPTRHCSAPTKPRKEASAPGPRHPGATAWWSGSSPTAAPTWISRTRRGRIVARGERSALCARRQRRARLALPGTRRAGGRPCPRTCRALHGQPCRGPLPRGRGGDGDRGPRRRPRSRRAALRAVHRPGRQPGRGGPPLRLASTCIPSADTSPAAPRALHAAAATATVSWRTPGRGLVRPPPGRGRACPARAARPRTSAR
jgi:hypothetical protein